MAEHPGELTLEVQRGDLALALDLLGHGRAHALKALDLGELMTDDRGRVAGHRATPSDGAELGEATATEASAASYACSTCTRCPCLDSWISIVSALEIVILTDLVMSIFKASKSHPCLNACLNYLHGLDAMETACQGYCEAAEVLLAEVIERGGTLDTLIYPIVFNWRHHVELRLKIIYLLGHALHEEKEAKIPRGHVLTKLWVKARPYVVKQWPHSPDSALKEVDEHIEDLAKHDEDSCVFRYTLDLKGSSALPKSLTHIGTVEFREVTARIAAMLEGISMGLNDTLQTYYEHLAEMRDEDAEWEADMADEMRDEDAEWEADMADEYDPED